MSHSEKNRAIRPAQVFAVSAGAALVITAAVTGTAAARNAGDDVARTTAQTEASAMAEACEEGRLCVWDQPGGRGKRVDLYYCGLEDVRAHGLARIGSFVNNQTDGTVATFKGPDESNPEGPWIDQYDSTAFEISDGDRGFTSYGVQVC